MATTELSSGTSIFGLAHFEHVMHSGSAHAIGRALAEVGADPLYERLFLANNAAIVGQGLLRAKSLVPRGEWTRWLEAFWPRSPREAQRYLALARGRTTCLPNNWGTK
jgi:hypothetical protein